MPNEILTAWQTLGHYEFEYDENCQYTGWYRYVGGRMRDGRWPQWKAGITEPPWAHEGQGYIKSLSAPPSASRVCVVERNVDANAAFIAASPAIVDVLTAELTARTAELKECQGSHGSKHGADWQNWKLAAAEVESLTAKLEAAELRCSQYDQIVRGVCIDLGISEDAGCDEIAMASAGRREATNAK